MRNVSSEKILKTFTYPQILKSKGDIDFIYNYKNDSGNFSVNFKNGKIVRRNLTYIPRTIAGLIYVFTGIDLVKELYKIIKINGIIKKKIITADMLIKSKLAEITTNKAIINLNRDTINSIIKIKLKDLKFSVKVKGKIKKPSIKLLPPKVRLFNLFR